MLSSNYVVSGKHCLVSFGSLSDLEAVSIFMLRLTLAGHSLHRLEQLWYRGVAGVQKMNGSVERCGANHLFTFNANEYGWPQ